MTANLKAPPNMPHALNQPNAGDSGDQRPQKALQTSANDDLGGHRRRKPLDPAQMLLSPADTAQMLGMSKSKLYALWRNEPENAPPAFCVGKNRYCSRASLLEWIIAAEGRVAVTA